MISQDRGSPDVIQITVINNLIFKAITSNLPVKKFSTMTTGIQSKNENQLTELEEVTQESLFKLGIGDSQQEKVEQIDDNFTPLNASIYTVSPMGNLTVTFNKPIIVPNITV